MIDDSVYEIRMYENVVLTMSIFKKSCIVDESEKIKNI
jgi:hypothetical protein